MKRLMLLLLSLGVLYPVYSKSFSIKGIVRDAETGKILPYATLLLSPSDKKTQANESGFFQFDNTLSGKYVLTSRFIGYEEGILHLLITTDTTLNVYLQPTSYALSEVVIRAEEKSAVQPIAMPTKQISRNYLLQNNATNFVKTLTAIPGIASMDIGSGFSKPVIRGLGFNRVAVVDKGIVQQNQQWGADHGLEIDQYDVDNVLIYKGPLSLYYGSDAIGGVIEIRPSSIPRQNIFWGDATLIGKSNNDLFGSSIMSSWKFSDWFVRARLTVQKFGDYRIPTDTITYLSWRMPIYNRRMKNTAGSEISASLSVNYSNDRINSWLHLSNVYGKNGFFPGSHGIPDVARLKHDGSYRNVDMPYASSQHFKASSNNIVRFSRAKLYVDIGYQQNYRKEMALFHTHYSNQSIPKTNPNLELSFLLKTISQNSRMVIDEKRIWTKTMGVSSEYQHNRVGGYSFLLPDYERFSGGVYWINQWKLSNAWTFMAGARYDFGVLNIHASYDPILKEYLQSQGYDASQTEFYAQRATAVKKQFSDMSGSIGVAFQPNQNHQLKINLGKSFRYPSANELASNGVHHGAFRHEKGMPELSSEKGYQLDIDYQYSKGNLTLSANPFVTYFSNYIFLEPTGVWSVLPHTGQIYEYKQARAWMSGGEWQAQFRFLRKWTLSANAEYVYNLNTTDRYPLPFSPPTVVTGKIGYEGKPISGACERYSLQLESRYIFAQNRIARNEEKTPGTYLMNASFNAHWNIGKIGFITNLQVQNIFDTAFLNHLSFYRKLNASEPGRNIQLILKIPF